MVVREERNKNKKKEIKEIGKMAGRSSRLIFGECVIISGAAAMIGMNTLPEQAAENVGEEMTVSEGFVDNVGTCTKADTNIDAYASYQTVENVSVNNPDGDVLAGNITDSKPQTLPPTGEIIAAAGLGGIALALAVYDIKN